MLADSFVYVRQLNLLPCWCYLSSSSCSFLAWLNRRLQFLEIKILFVSFVVAIDVVCSLLVEFDAALCINLLDISQIVTKLPHDEQVNL